MKTISQWDPTRLSAVLRWGLALLAATLAIALRIVIDADLPAGFPYLTFFPAVILGSFFLGSGPGVLIAVICGLAAWYWFIPPFASFLVTGSTLLALLFYVFIVGTTIVLTHLAQQALRDLEQQRRANAVLAEQRKLMFHELQHRVSNNLATVSGLMKLQRRMVQDPAAGTALDDSVRRIDLVARLMRHLHDPEGQTVDIARFLTEAGRDMLESGGAAGRVSLTVNAEPLHVGPEVSVPLGLIATELVANTLEHGFPATDRGSIRIGLVSRAPDRAELTIHDDGRGLPDGFDLAKTQSLGLSIARQFARQLGGSLQIRPRPDGGTEARLDFSV